VTVQVTDLELEEILLADFHRAGQQQDRLPDDPLALGLAGKLNQTTGVPESASDLKRHGAHGEKLQRDGFIMPRNFALLHLLRPCKTCETCARGDEDRCENGPRLKYVEPEAWTDEEGRDIAELESRIQNVFRRWEAEGLLIREPPLFFSGSRAGDEQWIAPDEKDQWAARLTTKGIERAKAWATSPDAPAWVRDSRRSRLWCMTDEQRRRAPQWQQKEFIAEGGKITGEASPLATRCPRCRSFHMAGEPCAPPPLGVPAYFRPATPRHRRDR
jgi:hypothetical protein